jgi:hypothetical protein
VAKKPFKLTVRGRMGLSSAGPEQAPYLATDGR